MNLDWQAVKDLDKLYIWEQLRQKAKPFIFNAAGLAFYAAHLEGDINVAITAPKITHPPPTFVIKAATSFKAAAALCFFERRSSVRTNDP